MSSRSYFPFFLLFLFLLSGCISKSVYTSLQHDHARIKNDSLLLEKRIRQLQDENERLGSESARMEQSLNNRLQEKQDSLTYKEQLLRDRELSLKDMKARKEEESEAFTTLTKAVFAGFSDYDQQTLTTHAGCASMTIQVNERKLFMANSTKTELLSLDLHAKMIALLAKYPDLYLSVVAYADSATVKEKSADPFNIAYSRSSALYRELVAMQPKAIRERISLAVKNELVSRRFPQQTDYVFYSSLIPCIHTK